MSDYYLQRAQIQSKAFLKIENKPLHLSNWTWKEKYNFLVITKQWILWRFSSGSFEEYLRMVLGESVPPYTKAKKKLPVGLVYYLVFLITFVCRSASRFVSLILSPGLNGVMRKTVVFRNVCRHMKAINCFTNQRFF